VRFNSRAPRPRIIDSPKHIPHAESPEYRFEDSYRLHYFFFPSGQLVRIVTTSQAHDGVEFLPFCEIARQRFFDLQIRL
jgi:hypothetical protein